MHIAEGMLPLGWAAAYYGATGVLLAKGVKEYRQKSVERPMFKQLVGLLTAAVFIISLYLCYLYQCQLQEQVHIRVEPHSQQF